MRLTLSMTVALASLLAASSVDAQTTRPDWTTWTEPLCFAYAPKHDTYACYDASLGSDSGVEWLGDFERWTPQQETAWNGHKAVVLVGAKTETIAIAEKMYDLSMDVTHTRTTREAVRVARKRGHRQTIARTRRLEPDRWVAFRGVWMRFSTLTHEGSASFEVYGTLRVSCERPISSEAGVEVIERSQGESAMAFGAAGTRSVVVGLMEVDGGEGAMYYNTKYIFIDLDSVCARKGGT